MLQSQEAELEQATFSSGGGMSAVEGRGKRARVQLLTVKEAARKLGVAPVTVYKLCGQGKLPHVRVTNNAIRVAVGDLAAFVKGRRR